jgi:hypothetical protein
MGGATTICSDKTGTLTTSRMTVRARSARIWAGDGHAPCAPAADLRTVSPFARQNRARGRGIRAARGAVLFLARIPPPPPPPADRAGAGAWDGDPLGLAQVVKMWCGGASYTNMEAAARELPKARRAPPAFAPPAARGRVGCVGGAPRGPSAVRWR